MKNFIRKIWDAIVSFINRVPHDKLLRFVAGVIIAAFFAISLGMKFCFWPVIFFAFGKEFSTSGPPANGIGGISVQLASVASFRRYSFC